VRKHWFVLLLELAIPIIALPLPFLLYDVVSGQEFVIGAKTVSVALPEALLSFFGAVWALIIWMKLFGIWTDYYLDTWVITNKRIVDIEQKGFFRRHTGSFRMERIQDVTIEINGILATLLRFGDIHVQTAGESREFVIKGIPKPKRLKEEILRQSDIVVEQTRSDEYIKG
jgi:uncharacterized membrane protein YdbT with pleckstrin-like domain